VWLFEVLEAWEMGDEIVFAKDILRCVNRLWVASRHSDESTFVLFVSSHLQHQYDKVLLDKL
jgi:hypothetical protein